MDHVSAAFIFGGGSSSDYMGMSLFWEGRGLRALETVDGWAVTSKGIFQCKFSVNGDFSHTDGVDTDGKPFYRWEFPEVQKSDTFRDGGISTGPFRCDARISDFPFFLTTLRGTWVHLTSLITRLSVEFLGDLPEVQQSLRATDRWNRVNRFESSPLVNAEEAIAEGMILPVEWGEMPRACIGVLHLRQRLNGREWLVDYYGVHGFEMKLQGAKLTHTVFDRWDTRKLMYPPGSLEFQCAASLSDEEKVGNARLSVEYGVIVGNA